MPPDGSCELIKMIKIFSNRLKYQYPSFYGSNNTESTNSVKQAKADLQSKGNMPLEFFSELLA